MSLVEDRVHMARAIVLAREGLYTTHPNPRVGALLVKAGRILGEGYHHRAGEPHAERLALAMAGADAVGATAYVSLEPCCHHGRTPPCTEALIAAGVSRVVAAMIDPNPLMSGRGLAVLEAAGIAVEHGLLEAEARALNPGFCRRMAGGLPYVRCKLAMSLDGRTAMASGESRWITSEAARRDVHRLRARSSAILTGIGTVLADDPSLTVRLPAGDLGEAVVVGGIRQPLRVVLDPQLRLPPSARLLKEPGRTLVLHSRGQPGNIQALTEAGAMVVGLAGGDESIDLRAVLVHLAGMQINEVLIEAGPTLAGAAISAGLVDELLLYLAPHLMGDAARPLMRLPGLHGMADRLELDILDIRALGRDWRILAKPVGSQ